MFSWIVMRAPSCVRDLTGLKPGTPILAVIAGKVTEFGPTTDEIAKRIRPSAWICVRDEMKGAVCDALNRPIDRVQGECV